MSAKPVVKTSFMTQQMQEFAIVAAQVIIRIYFVLLMYYRKQVLILLQNKFDLKW